MSERNENRPWYKKTKVGWIPTHWECAPLADLACVQTGLAKGKKNLKNPTRLPYLRVANVQDGFLNLDEVKEIEVEKDDVERYRLRRGDVLFTEGGDFDKLGRGTIWKDEIMRCLHQNHIFAVRCNETRLLPYFLAALSAGPYGRRYFILSSKQSTNLASINSTQLREFPLPVAPLPEQKKIAEILSTWDEAIDHMRSLIDAKKSSKKALMQQLLTGRLRLGQFGKPAQKLSRFPGDWQRMRARELFEVRSVKKRNTEPVLSVTQDMGVVPRDTVERKIGFSETNTHAYKLVEPGDFVISLRSFQGGIEYSNYRGIVSPAYHVIRPTREVDNTFYKYYFKCHDFIGHLVVAVIGIRDGKQVSYADFAFMYFPYPSIEEQKAIGEILVSIDEDIKVCKKKLTALEKQKRGLMQKLLTGEIRVKT